MNWSEEQIRRIYRTGADAATLDDDRVADLALGDTVADPAELNRLARSAADADRFCTLREVAHWSGKTPAMRTAWSGTRLVAALAALVAAAWLGLALLSPPRQEVLRGAGDLRFSPADGARLSALPRQLQWPAAEGAMSYRATLYDRELSALWVSDWTPDNRLSLPPSAFGAQQRGPFFWRITVDRELYFDTLPLHSFQVAPAQ